MANRDYEGRKGEGMRIIQQSAKLIRSTQKPLHLIEHAARVCYASKKSKTDEEREKFIRGLIKAGHESVLEHASATFEIVTDRAIANEMVRHRMASYSQESTRYVDMSDMPVIPPLGWVEENGYVFGNLTVPIKEIEQTYNAMRRLNRVAVPKDQARDILPLCLATRLVMTANFREWRHILSLRMSKRAHPKMQQLACMIFEQLKELSPVVFEDIQEKEGVK